MWNSDTETRGSPKSRSARKNGPDGDGERNPANRLLGVGLVFALAFFLASLMPPALVAPVLRELLFWAAVGGVVGALFRREPPLGASGMTGWDQAAILLLISLSCGFFVDPEAARQTLAQLQTAASAGAS